MIIGDTAGPVDRAKQLVNLATNQGRELQSSQTGLVHLCYRSVDEVAQQTIPLVENFLFALALLRERTSETVTEAKRILDRLLYFQSFYDEESQGNFPVYIDQFPQCKDPLIGGQLLPIFYWILKNFNLLLGPQLRESMHTSASALFHYCHHYLKTRKAPFVVALNIAAASQALGKLWDNAQVEKEANEELARLCIRSQEEDFDAWADPKALGEMLVALQMVYEELANSPWKHLWEKASLLWQEKTATFVGPPLFERQSGLQPQITLFDLVMGHQTGINSYRAYLPGIHLLSGALIHPFDDALDVQLPRELKGFYREGEWHVRHTADYTLALSETAMQRDRYGCAMRMVWGDTNFAHSLVCQGGNAEKVAYTLVDDGVDLLFTLPEEPPQEMKQRNREVQLFLAKHEGANITVAEEIKATAFQLEEPITIDCGGLRVEAVFRLESGEGQFFGHIAPGDRPSQCLETGKERFECFDWHLFLRTVERQSRCQIKVSLRVAKGEVS